MIESVYKSVFKCSNHQYISDRNTEAILIDNDSTFYFGVYQENYLLKAIVSNNISLIETPLTNELKAFPNPVSDKLWISDLQGGSATVYSISVNKVMEQSLEHGSLNLVNLAPGVYYLKVLDEDLKNHQLKFIKN